MSIPLDVAQGLPVPLTPLIGRERETAGVLALLRRDDVRLVTLFGPGGVGKTRLALAVLASVAAEFPGGACVVSLGPIDDPALVVPAIAKALGIAETGDVPLVEQIVGAIGLDSQLLVLDCFERVLPASTLLTELLTPCPGLKIMVTSRVVLRLTAEHLFPVAPLALPDATVAASPFDASDNEAVQLFAARSRAAGAGFEQGDDGAATVTAICRRLEGLPLAIELAAARTRLFPPDALLARLDRALPQLTGGPNDAPERHRTLASTIAWSYDLLDEPERRALRSLAVFASGCTLDAARAVGCEESQISVLVDHSLLHRVDRPGEDVRFAMLDTVREFALDRQEESGEADDLRRGHAAWCLDLMASAAAAIGTANQQRWTRTLDIEHDNLRAALRSAHLAGDGESLVRLVASLWRYWYARGFCTEGRLWVAMALESSPAVTPRDRIELLIGLGTLAHAQGDEVPAAEAGEEALALARHEHDAHGLALALALMGVIDRDRGEYGRAVTSLEESLALFRDIADPWGITLAINSLAVLYQLRGDYDRATGVLAEGARLAESRGDMWTSAQVLSNMAHLNRRRGDFERAADLYERSAVLYRELGYQRGEAGALTNLGRIAERLGDLGRAVTLHEQSLVATRAIGDRRGTATALANLGLARLRSGDLEAAGTSLRESLAIRGQLGDREGVATSLEKLAEVAGAAQQPERALRLWASAAALRDEIGAPLAPSERASYDTVLATARSMLDGDRIAELWAEGRKRAIADAIDYALSHADEDTREAADTDRSSREAMLVHPSGLTPRELDVLRLLEEHTDREIADQLYIGPRTVATHVTNILNKLGVNSRTAAVGYAIRHGYI